MKKGASTRSVGTKAKYATSCLRRLCNQQRVSQNWKKSAQIKETRQDLEKLKMLVQMRQA